MPILQKATDKFFSLCDRLKSIEAIGGTVLLIFAVIAMFWANSQYAESYQNFLHSEITLNIAGWVLSADVHFIINDILMTIFFLVVGLEVRREIYDGSLADLRVAFLPIMAAFGGVLVPALIYWTISSPNISQGWAIPTATDIAFAVGVLALLGKSVPSSVRIFLLTLAIIDDIVAVLIIAVFYSSGLDAVGLGYFIAGIAIIILLQKMGIFSIFPYIFPSILIWYGLLKVGIHPSLAGVLIGLMTPVFSRPNSIRPLQQIENILNEYKHAEASDPQKSVTKLKLAQRELINPIERVSYLFSPWVAFLIMPLFALANAGVDIGNVDLEMMGSMNIMVAITIALVVGKPLGIFLTTWFFIFIGLGRVPAGFNYHWLFLISCLAGIGFTMSIFIANLAFTDTILLSSAKIGILIGSSIAAVLGLVIGLWVIYSMKIKSL
ncbi:sodium:proton antiporter [Acinetobacter sp. ANC 4558]|nr:sodium:proton antiporter [Acinetobacter sp. ANC 4558]